jgi:hypothetical protein
MPAFSKSLALALWLSAAPLGASAQAQKLSLHVGKSNEHGRFSLTLGSASPACAPRRGPARVWVAGRYETRCERVWVPGCTRQEWVPPCYEGRFDPCGRRIQVLVRAGHWRTIQEPGRHELREVQVWVPGHWRVQGY